MSGNVRWTWRVVAILAAAAACGTVGVSAASAQVKVDAKLPAYKASVGVSGTIKSVGSDTMNNLMTLWGEGFQKFYPAVRIEIEGKGTSTAMPALVAGTSTFGPMSRDPKQDEIDQFEKKFGYKPVVIDSSIDMLAVYVHKDNPIKSLSLSQVDAIFSSTRKLGADKDAGTWGGVGLEGAFQSAPIALYGRNSASGTYGYFKEHALGKGDFKDDVKEMPGSSAVVQAVGGDQFGIGYSGIGYKTADVRAVAIAKKDGGKAVAAEPQFGYTGDYPLSRKLLLALNVKPNTQLEPLRREFIKYMLSKEGQEVVLKDGYLPLTAPMAKKALLSVGIKADF